MENVPLTEVERLTRDLGQALRQVDSLVEEYTRLSSELSEFRTRHKVLQIQHSSLLIDREVIVTRQIEVNQEMEQVIQDKSLEIAELTEQNFVFASTLQAIALEKENELAEIAKEAIGGTNEEEIKSKN